MRILVTGGLGVVGSGLCSHLRAGGHHVVSCDLLHNHDEIGFSLRTDVEVPLYARCDVGEYRQLERVFENMGPFSYVYHCAAEFGRWNGEDFYEQLWKTNAVGTKNVIRLQEKHRFRLIYFSSSEVYGDWPGLMVENVMDKYEVKQLNDYAMSKWVGEMQVMNSRTQHDTETVVVRLFNTYGPGEYYSPYRSVNCRFVYCALKKIPWVVFSGHNRTSLWLPDAISTLGNILNNFKPGEVYNLGGDKLHSVEELSDAVIRVTGADPTLAEHRESEILTTKKKIADVSKASRDLFHKNTYLLEDGLKETADWMKKIYEI